MACASPTPPAKGIVQPRLAQDVLDLEFACGVDHGRAVVDAQCACGWSAGGQLIVVREIEADDHVDLVDFRDGAGVRVCDWCGGDLLPDVLYKRVSALNVLRAARSEGIAEVPVACADCGHDLGGHLVLADSAGRDIGWWGRGFYIENADDPEWRGGECPSCWGELHDPNDVVLRVVREAVVS